MADLEVHSDYDQEVSALRERLRRYLSDNPGKKRQALKESLRKLHGDGWTVFFFGGLLRDIMLHGGLAKPVPAEFTAAT